MVPGDDDQAHGKSWVDDGVCECIQLQGVVRLGLEAL